LGFPPLNTEEKLESERKNNWIRAGKKQNNVKTKCRKNEPGKENGWIRKPLSLDGKNHTDQSRSAREE